MLTRSQVALLAPWALVLSACDKLEAVADEAARPSPALAADAGDFAKFDKACREDTITMGYDDKGELIRTGSDIDAYCRGFLEGSYWAMRRAGSICVEDDRTDTSAYYLRSIVQRYVEEVKPNGGSRHEIVWAAFDRAFNCAAVKAS